MTDDQRPRDAHADDEALPAGEGLRSDQAGTSAPGSVTGPAPGGGARDRETLPPTGQGTASGGGYGVGSDRASSGGSGEGQQPAGEDEQTQWLRQED